MPRSLLISIGVLSALGAVAAAVWTSGHGTAPLLETTTATTAFEAKLRERAAALSARVATLADLPRLSSAVATDPTTVRDLTSEELAFRPRDGEIITIAQRLHDGKRVPLLTLPDGAEAEPATTPGTQVSLRGGKMILARTLDVVPAERKGELTGLLTVTTAIDPSDLSAPLLGAAPGARVTVGGATLALGAPFPEDPTAGVRTTARLPDGVMAVVTFAKASGSSSGVGWGATAALGAMALGALVLGARRKVTPPPSGETSAVGLDGPRAGTSPGAGSAPVVGRAGETLPSSSPQVAPTNGGRGGAAFAPTVVPAAINLDGAAESRIGRYAILRRLGQGGMAEVFLARAEGEAGFGKLVAFKVLQPAFASTPAVVDLFLDEARLVSGLDHPNIVQTHDLGRAGDRYFIAMEYIDGSDLARLIEGLRARSERIPVPCALGILCRVCDGLNAAHTAVGPDGAPLGLVHRDVKSPNVFVSRTGVIKVGDFGIAKASHAVRLSRTEVGQVKGTPGTMAPEQRLGQEVDRRADVYGVGAIAYELLSGSPVNLDLVALAARGIAGWPHLPPLASLRPDVPRELDAIIFKALAYERADRYEDCVVLEHAFRSIGTAIGISEDKAIGTWMRGALERIGAPAAAAGAGTAR